MVVNKLCNFFINNVKLIKQNTKINRSFQPDLHFLKTAVLSVRKGCWPLLLKAKSFSMSPETWYGFCYWAKPTESTMPWNFYTRFCYWAKPTDRIDFLSNDPKMSTFLFFWAKANRFFMMIMSSFLSKVHLVFILLQKSFFIIYNLRYW